MILEKSPVPTIGSTPVKALALRGNRFYLEGGKEKFISETVPVRINPFESNWFGQTPSKETLYKELKWAHQWMDKILGDMKTLTAAIIGANAKSVHWDLGALSLDRVTAHLHSHMNHGADLAVKEPQEIHASMDASLANGRLELARLQVNQFRRLQQMEICGGIYWLAPDVCVFNWYMWKGNEQRGPTTTTVHAAAGGNTHRHQTEVTTVIVQELHQHQIMNAERRVCAVYDDMPKRVRSLIAAIPDWLAPHVQVVYGDEIVHDTVERVISRSTRTDVTEEFVPIRQQVSEWDPAVIVGDVVLTAWRPGEAY